MWTEGKQLVNCHEGDEFGISTEEVVIVQWIEGNKGCGNNIPCTTNFEFKHIFVQVPIGIPT